MNPSPLAPEHFDLIASSLRRSRKLHKAARVARFNGMTMIVFAVLSLAFGLGSPTDLFLGLVLGIVAVRELMAAKRLDMLKLDAPRSLAISEGILACGLVTYAALKIAQAFHPDPATTAQVQQLDAVLGSDGSQSLSHMVSTITIVAYIGLAVGSIITQGLLVLYYLKRGRMLQGYLSQTPAWIVQLERTIRSA